MTAYQDTWRDGACVAEGERDCEGRYEAIRGVLDQLTEPFSVLDVGAYTGYFALRIAEDYDASVLAVDSRPEILDAEGERVQALVSKLDAGKLRHLPRHDVILALSVLHHFADWRGVLRELRACRRSLIIETPHPDERWMRHAAAREQLGELHEAVRSLGELVYESPRVGRDGSEWMRPTYLLPGTVEGFTGEVFSGSGNNSRSLARYADASLTDALGYEPFHGSLNARVGPVGLSGPSVRWERRIGAGRRSYDAWRAWIGGVAGHVIVPTTKPGWAHPETLECWAPVKLRDALGLTDGDVVAIDVEHR